MKFEQTYAYPNWIYHGLIWGGFMFMMMEILIPFARSEAISLKTIVVGTVVWGLAGLAWGYLMHLFYGRRKKKEE